MSTLVGVLNMKVVNSIIFAVAMVFVSSALAAYELPKDTLHVERFSMYQNGTGSGKSLAQHTFIKRYYTPEDCTLAAKAYSSQTSLDIGGNNMTVLTVARCEAINHSIYQ
jgi:hypothetical protein